MSSNYNKNKNKNKEYKKSYMEHQRDTKRKRNKADKSYKQRLVRGQLYDLLGQEVRISAVLTRRCLVTTMDNGKAVLFTDCVVDTKLYERHFWIILPDEVRNKLLLAPDSSRVYFTGIPHTYTSRHEHESDKVGITNIRLVTEIN